MIHEEICTYEVAKLAKERGFDVPTAEFYNDDGNIGCYPRAFNHNEFPDGDYAAPTQSLLQRWLREERYLHITISTGNTWKIEDTRGVPLFPNGNEDEMCMSIRSTSVRWDECYGAFDTYELALEDALKYALENLV